MKILTYIFGVALVRIHLVQLVVAQVGQVLQAPNQEVLVAVGHAGVDAVLRHLLTEDPVQVAHLTVEKREKKKKP